MVRGPAPEAELKGRRIARRRCRSAHRGPSRNGAASIARKQQRRHLCNIASVVDDTEDNWDSHAWVDLKGVWLCMKFEIMQMLKQGSGSIVNTPRRRDWLAGRMGAYAAAKHGVIGLTRTAALEYAAIMCASTRICPGVIGTPVILGWFREQRQARKIDGGAVPDRAPGPNPGNGTRSRGSSPTRRHS